MDLASERFELNLEAAAVLWAFQVLGVNLLSASCCCWEFESCLSETLGLGVWDGSE